MNSKTVIAVIDNNESYSALFSKIIEQNNFEPFKINTIETKIEGILQNLKKEKPSLVFINAGACLNENDNPASQLGVDILKHIRLTEDLEERRTVPVILYSFAKDKEDFIRLRPENLIVFSEGSYYFNIFNLNRSLVEGLINVGNDFLIGNNMDIKQLRDLNPLRSYIKVDTTGIILEDRHSIANWWGPQRLLWGYKLSLPPDRREIPEGNPVMKNFIEEKKKLPVKKLLFTIDKQEVLNEGKIKETCKEFDLIKLKEKVKGQDGSYKKVLYIDDEAYLGWANAFKQILFPDISKFFDKMDEKTQQLYLTDHGQEIFTVYQSFEKAKEEITPDLLKTYALVLLDLRDKTTDIGKQQPDQLTGVNLLKKIKDPEKGDPSIPVIIITASNKQWNYERILELGANGYWIKESPEFGIDEEYSLRNYLKLRNIIAEVLSREYLRKIWWDCVKTCKDKLTSEGKGNIHDLLMKAFLNWQYRSNKDCIYNASKVFPLQDVLLFLSLAFEQYSSSWNITGRDINVIEYFLYYLRGSFIHGTKVAELLEEDDIISFFVWFKNLVVRGDEFPQLEYNREKHKHIMKINDQEHEPVKGKNAEYDRIKSYVNFWKFLKYSGKGNDTDSDMIRDRAKKILGRSEYKGITLE